MEYNATDENGNSTLTPLGYTINVMDTARPTITYTGSSFKDEIPYMQVEAGSDTDIEDESLMQLTATDSKGVEMTAPDIYIFNSRGYSPDRIGYYIINYIVDDSYGKTALPFDYAIEVKDTKAPNIEGATSLTKPLSMGTSINLKDPSSLGITIEDTFDPNPTLILQDNDGFDKNKPGTYTISYDAIDGSGNLYSKEHSGSYYTYTISVADQEAPMISGLKGETITAGSAINQAYIDDYASRGLTVTDNYDSTPNVIAEYVDITGAPVIPNTSKVGNIYVNYDAIDASGNKYSDPHPVGSGSQYQFIISVVDNEAPEIRGVNSSDVDFGVPSKNFDYLNPELLGLTITDNTDKNPQLIIDTDSDIYDGTKIGTYHMKYLAVDNENNASAIWEYTITITTQPPTILTNGDQTITINPSITDDWIKSPENVGIKASGEDANFDGVSDDLTDLIKVKENGGFDSTKVGVYPVTYEVVDPTTEKTDTATINIITKDDIKPRFFGQTQIEITKRTKFNYKTSDATGLYLSTDSVMNIEEGIDSGIITISNLGRDGDASTTADNFVGGGEDESGVYKLEYTAVYNGYTETSTYTINVVSPIKPLILGKNNAEYDINAAIPFNKPRNMGMVAISSAFSDITDSITISSITNEDGEEVELSETGPNKAGMYKIVYEVIDPYTLETSKPFDYTLKISSSNPPIFTYIAPKIASDQKGMLEVSEETPNSVTETWQGGYDGDFSNVDSRLSAVSSEDGSILPVGLVSIGGYNKNVIGSYDITYEAVDAKNDVSSTFIITVVVKDTLPPEIIGETTFSTKVNIPYQIETNTGIYSQDLVDGEIDEWSLFSGTKGTIAHSNGAWIDSSGHLTETTFDENGENKPGNYDIRITATDRSGNSKVEEIYIKVLPNHVAPTYTGEIEYTVDDYGHNYYVFEDFSDTNAMMSNSTKIIFTDYDGHIMPYIHGSTGAIDPNTNMKNGVFWAGGDAMDNQIEMGSHVYQETYCATDVDYLTTCHRVDITINRTK